MAMTPIPPLDRTSAGFKASLDELFESRIPNFIIEANALGVDAVKARAAQDAASASASMAAAAVEAAEYMTGLAAWVSGRTYQKNEIAISQVNFQVYRRRVTGAGTLDPANDTSGNWALRAGAGSFIPQQVAATSIDLSRGNDFYLILDGSKTLTFDGCPQDGYSFTLDVDVTSGVLTLPSTVRTQNNVSYVLTAGKGHLLMFRTRNRGARWRLVAATNFDL